MSETKPSPFPDIATVLLALGAVALAVYTRSETILLGSDAIVACAILAGFCAIVPAVYTTALLPAVRHVIYLHYAVFASLASWIWLVPLTVALEGSDRWAAYQPLLAGAMLCALPWSLAHLMAVCSGRPRNAAAWAMGSIVLSLALMRPENGLLFAAILIGGGGLLAWVLPTRESTPMNTAHDAVGVGAYLLVNVAAVAGFLPVLALIYWYQFQVGMDFTIDDVRQTLLVAPEELAPRSPFPIDIVVLRYLSLGAGIILGFSTTFLLPRGTITRVRIVAAVVALAAAASATGLHSPTMMTVAICALLIAVLAGALLCTTHERSARLPEAILLGGVAGTIAMQVPSAVLAQPFLGAFTWMLEAAVLAVLWITIYLTALRPIRNREQVAPAASPAPPSPPTA